MTILEIVGIIIAGFIALGLTGWMCYRFGHIDGRNETIDDMNYGEGYVDGWNDGYEEGYTNGMKEEKRHNGGNDQ